MMTRQAQISTLVSIILHVLVLFIFAWVKINTDESVESGVPVAFVSVKKTKPLRRSAVVRPMISLSQSPQRHSPEQYTVRPEHRSSAETYVVVPEKVFSSARIVGQEVFQSAGVQRPDVELRGHLARSVAAKIPEAPRPGGAPARILGGYELLSDMAPAPAKPDIDVANDVLQSFARIVRRKIESSKKYPIAAQSAGIEGRVVVRMTLLKDGRLEKAEIAKSSGHEILDKAALQSVRGAVPFPPIPDKVRRNELQMSITLVFRIL